MGNHLKSLRKDRDWTLQEAADAMGVSRGQYIKLERGERRLTTDYISSAARGFNVKPYQVFSDDLPATVSLKGKVGAASVAHYHGEAHELDEEVPMPIGGNERTVALEIDGTSMGPALDGWLVYYDERHDPPHDGLLGKLCILGLADGRVLLKTLKRGTRPGHWNLQSQTEGVIEDAVVDWAAKVLAMTPR